MNKKMAFVCLLVAIFDATYLLLSSFLELSKGIVLIFCVGMIVLCLSFIILVIDYNIKGRKKMKQYQQAQKEQQELPEQQLNENEEND